MLAGRDGSVVGLASGTHGLGQGSTMRRCWSHRRGGETPPSPVTPTCPTGYAAKGASPALPLLDDAHGLAGDAAPWICALGGVTRPITLPSRPAGASSTRRNADIARNCPSVRRMAAKSARLRRCSSSKMGKHRLVVAPGIRTHFATTIRNDHLLQATSAPIRHQSNPAPGVGGAGGNQCEPTAECYRASGA